MGKRRGERSVNITRYIFWEMNTVTENAVPRITEQGAIKLLEQFKKIK